MLIWLSCASERCRGTVARPKRAVLTFRRGGRARASCSMSSHPPLSRRARDDGNLDRHHQRGREVMKASVRKAATLRRPATPRNNDRRVLGPHPRRRFLRLAAGTAVLPAVSRVAWAQAYPTRPIIMVVPIAAGSSSDAVGRLVAERMGTALGQPIIIENVAGADGS